MITTAVAPTPIMTAPISDYGNLPLDPGLDVDLAGQRQFKRHKSLPRPRNERAQYNIPRKPVRYDLIINTSQFSPDSASQPSSPRALKHQPKRIGSGPDLPPTPPNQSRNSSNSYSSMPSGSANADTTDAADTTVTSPPIVEQRPPATPPDQRSPPTPDVTPPQPTSRPRALRSTALDRAASRTATTNSRSESFKTAREEPFSSEDEGARSTIRPDTVSARTSQTTILRIPESRSTRVPQPQALDIALERLSLAHDNNYTPRTRREFGQFDGDWGSVSDVEQEWDDNLQRNVTVKRRKESSPRSQPTARKGPVLDTNIVTPTNATKAVRNMPLREAAVLQSPLRGRSDGGVRSTAQSSTESPTSRDTRRSSGISGTSNTSAAAEAHLLDTSPKRQRTLRHVRKQRALRDSSVGTRGSRDITAQSRSPDRQAARAQPQTRAEVKARHESLASTHTNTSISSGRARREIWKAGAIPVVVVPDRRSSHKSASSREPSLRSMSSKRSKRATSVDSSPVDEPMNKDATPIFERPRRRSRAMSDSERSDVRTIDFPPAIPARSSSLSAPTSRNASRAGSMTADSLRARNVLDRPTEDLPKETLGEPPIIKEPAPEPSSSLGSPHTALGSPRAWSGFGERETRDGLDPDRLDPDRHDSLTPVRKYSSRNTPFSIASFETTGTAPELSEAFAIQMYPHQNSSLVMVNHSSKPSDASEATKKDKDVGQETLAPYITATGPDGIPVTPPQQQTAFSEVDSPLRNPRAPPDPPANPPALNFIPATPSGTTPAHEQTVQLGNFFEAADAKPPRRPSLVRRALSRRRHSISYPPSASKSPGFLTRTFSLSRNMRNAPDSRSSSRANSGRNGDATYPQVEDGPVEQGKLHPFWRPQWLDDETCDCNECVGRSSEEGGRVYKYPPIDNRPRMPRRSLSARVKQVFAVMPARSASYYLADDHTGPKLRTIRRTSSGNLRVMRHRASADPLEQRSDVEARPSTSPQGESRRGFWRGNSLRRRASKEMLRRSSISSRLENIPNIPRILSERRREKRTQELRQKISGPREVRDGVGDVIRPGNIRGRVQEGAHF